MKKKFKILAKDFRLMQDRAWRALAECFCLFSLLMLMFPGVSFLKADQPKVKVPISPVPVQRLPDLKVTGFSLSGEQTAGDITRDGKSVHVIKQRFDLRFENRGLADAGEFRIGIFFEVSGGTSYRVYLDSTQDNWFLTVNSLRAGQSYLFSGYLCFEEQHSGKRGRAFAILDIPENDLRAEYANIRELNENNNVSERLNINVAPIFRAAPPPPLQIKTPITFSITEGLLDILGSVIRGRIHLNNDNGHSDSDHFTTNEPFRRNDSSIRVNDFSEQFTVPVSAFELNSMDYRYYIRDLDAEFGGGAGFRGRDLLGIWDGQLRLTIRFETGGRVEFRGWELTTGIYYDLSAPDIDITKLDVFISLTPQLRDDGIFTYSDARVTTDLQISFIGAYDTALMNDIRIEVRATISREISRALQEAILRADIRNEFETRAMEAFHSFKSFARLTRMIVEDRMITFECR